VSLQLPAPEEKFSAPIDLRQVRRLFGRAQRVAPSAFLRREIAARMHERLGLIKIAPDQVLDAGCGEGADLASLQQRFPQAQIIGVDGAPAMLTAAGAQLASAKSGMARRIGKWLPALAGGKAAPDLLCTNFAQLPLRANALDMLWSNLALHWHPQPDRVFAEWRRVLRVNGLLMFSCFGPDAFKEVRAAFATVGMAQSVLPFVDMHDFGDMLLEAGFATPVMDMEAITVTYADAAQLLADVRAFGGNPLATRARGLLGRSQWRAVIASLEQNRRPDGRIALTFEVIYGHAFRPQPRMTAAGEPIIRFDALQRHP
jgi:malonyl-CoA O-methyltransferase